MPFVVGVQLDVPGRVPVPAVQLRPGDRIEPRPQAVRIAELLDAFDGDQERVVHDVGGVGLVGTAARVVMQHVGVAVVQLGDRITIPEPHPCDDLPVVHWRRSLRHPITGVGGRDGGLSQR